MQSIPRLPIGNDINFVWHITRLGKREHLNAHELRVFMEDRYGKREPVPFCATDSHIEAQFVGTRQLRDGLYKIHLIGNQNQPNQIKIHTNAVELVSNMQNLDSLSESDFCIHLYTDIPVPEHKPIKPHTPVVEMMSPMERMELEMKALREQLTHSHCAPGEFTHNGNVQIGTVIMGNYYDNDDDADESNPFNPNGPQIPSENNTPSGGGGNTSGGNNQGGSSSGNNQGGSSSGNNQGGSSSGDNQGGSSSGDNQGGSSSGDNQGGSSSGDNQGGNTSTDVFYFGSVTATKEQFPEVEFTLGNPGTIQNGSETSALEAVAPCFYVLYPTDYTISGVKFGSSENEITSVADDSEKMLTHNNVTVNSKTYKVFGYRVGACSATNKVYYKFTLSK